MKELFGPERRSVDQELAERYAQGALEKTLLWDFRQSFRFSGAEFNQHVIFPLLGFVYSRTDESVQQGIDEALDSIDAKESWRKAALPPAQHIPVDEEHFLRESANEWNKFRQFVRPMYVHQLQQEDEDFFELTWEEELLRLFGENLAESDIKILNSVEGRPRSNADMRYKSYFREYVILGKSSGSPAFNDIFARTREMTLAYPPSWIRHMISGWRRQHPGRTFFPDALNLVNSVPETSLPRHLQTDQEYMRRSRADELVLTSGAWYDIGMQAVRQSVSADSTS